jgi:hypothetical protein
MKKTVILYLLIAVLVLSGCGTSKNKITIDNSENITQIEIQSYPGSLVTTENKNEIEDITNYINSLDLKKAAETPVSGMAYAITVNYNDKTSKQYSHIGNVFFVDPERNWYKIAYGQAIKFDMIVANIMERKERESGEALIQGTVVSVNSESSGRNISCTIKDKDNKSYDVNLDGARIVDSTGSGYLILHNSDEVAVYFRSTSPVVTANSVFIKKHPGSLK